MHSKNISFFTLLAFVALAFSACKKNELRLTQYDLPTDKAYVRFALFSPGTPSVMIKVNDVKVNGATTSGTGGIFPSVTNTPDYSAIAPNGNFRLSLPNIGTINDSVVIFSGPLAVDAGKFYAITLADTGVDRTLFAIEDKREALPDSGFFTIRLINAMPKSAPINLIRVDSSSATAVLRDTIARNINFKSATEYIRTSISAAPGYSILRFRTVTNTGQLLSATTAPAANTINKRAVTIYASGYANGTLTLAPALSSLFIFNQ